MSVNHRTFELKQEHIALIKALEIKPEKLSLLGCVDTQLTPFSGLNLMDDLGNLLIGRELSEMEKERLTAEGVEFKTRDDVDYMKQIYSELPTALDVILNTLSFEVGTYRTRWYERNWKKID